jgi:hypothetical protein
MKGFYLAVRVLFILAAITHILGGYMTNTEITAKNKALADYAKSRNLLSKQAQFRSLLSLLKSVETKTEKEGLLRQIRPLEKALGYDLGSYNSGRFFNGLVI